MDILEVTAADFQREFFRYQDLALQQAVAITREGHGSIVLISTDEYLRLKRQDRQVLGLADYTAADLEALDNARPPIEAARFDDELDH